MWDWWSMSMWLRGLEELQGGLLWKTFKWSPNQHTVIYYKAVSNYDFQTVFLKISVPIGHSWGVRITVLHQSGIHYIFLHRNCCMTACIRRSAMSRKSSSPGHFILNTSKLVLVRSRLMMRNRDKNHTNSKADVTLQRFWTRIRSDAFRKIRNMWVSS